MAMGRRCDAGCESWPDSNEYEICPNCGDTTTRFRNLNPLEKDEARTKKLTLEFEDFYQDRCEERKISADGPMPSSIGPLSEEQLECLSSVSQ